MHRREPNRTEGLECRLCPFQRPEERGVCDSAACMAILVTVAGERETLRIAVLASRVNCSTKYREQVIGFDFVEKEGG